MHEDCSPCMDHSSKEFETHTHALPRANAGPRRAFQKSRALFSFQRAKKTPPFPQKRRTGNLASVGWEVKRIAEAGSLRHETICVHDACLSTPRPSRLGPKPA